MLSIHEVLQRRYRIVRLIGEGSTGAVYEAVDESFGEPVAVKEVVYELTKSIDENNLELLRNAFRLEAKSLAKARHPTIPYVRDYFFDRQSQYLVTDLVEGDDLGTLLYKRGNPFPTKDVLDWADQLLDALTYLHTLVPQVIHGDIKPKNLKLSEEGRIRLLDLGITKSVDDTAFTIRPAGHELSALNYLSFEQVLHVVDPTFREFILLKHRGRAERVLKQSCDVRSDIYMLGATIYYLMTNCPATDIVKRTIDTWEGASDPLPAPSDLNPDVPPSVGKCILKALAIDREDRHASATAMRSSLNEAADSSPKPVVLPTTFSADSENSKPNGESPEMLRLAVLPISNGYVTEKAAPPFRLGATPATIPVSPQLPDRSETQATTKLTFSAPSSVTNFADPDALRADGSESRTSEVTEREPKIPAETERQSKRDMPTVDNQTASPVSEPKTFSPGSSGTVAGPPLIRPLQAPQKSHQQAKGEAPAIGRVADRSVAERVDRPRTPAAAIVRTNRSETNTGRRFKFDVAGTWEWANGRVTAARNRLRSIAAPQFPLWLILTAIAGVLTIAGIGGLVWLLSLSRPSADISTANPVPNRPAGQLPGASVAEPQPVPPQAQPPAVRSQTAQPVASPGNDQASILDQSNSARTNGTQKQIAQKQITEKPAKQNQTDPKAAEVSSPTPAPTKPEKKKITVDDLINDN